MESHRAWLNESDENGREELKKWRKNLPDEADVPLSLIRSSGRSLPHQKHEQCSLTSSISSFFLLFVALLLALSLFLCCCCLFLLLSPPVPSLRGLPALPSLPILFAQRVSSRSPSRPLTKGEPRSNQTTTKTTNNTKLNKGTRRERERENRNDRGRNRSE